MANKPWHILSVNDTLKDLDTDTKNGLSQKEIKKRQKKFGPNKLPTKKKLSLITLFFSQFNNVLIYILLVAAAISFALHEFVDGYIIMAAVFINVIVGFIQEYKAQTALENLAKVIQYKCIVIRQGKHLEIFVEELVPGDLLVVSAGNNIPADCRLVQVNDFEVNEASLTGESLPVSKKIIAIKNKKAVIGDRFNMMYMGTLVTRGDALGVVVNTGLNTEMGNIASLIKGAEEGKTPLQKQLAIFSKKLGVIILLACGIIFVVGIITGKPFVEMFLIAVAAAVSAIPEGLVVSITVILAIGMQRILKKHALVRKLVAAETLGSTDVVCSDKTGTLTEGKMSTEELVTLKHISKVKDIENNINKAPKDIQEILRIGMLCNDSVVENVHLPPKDWNYIGAPTENAELAAGYQAGLDRFKLLDEIPQIDKNPFNSSRKYMYSLHKLSVKENIVYFNGAPEKILDMSTYVLDNGKEVFLTKEHKATLLELHKGYTEKGLRLLGVGYKKVASSVKKIDKVEVKEIVFGGYYIIKDPVRKGVRETIARAKRAGIKTVMITGDHKNTAKAIAKELGLGVSDNLALEGTELMELTDKELKERVKEVSVYARVSPEDKLRIVRAFQENDHIVAMTGDGVNDAPALKTADIGIAVGSGTDVTKGVADMVLLDNNFKTIIAAIKQGRIIVDNIKKVIVYLLADSFSEMVLILGALLLGLPLPITAAQILWINLVADSFPNVALTAEKGEKDVMALKPRKKKSGILDSEMKALIFIIGIITDIFLLLLFVYYFKSSGDIGHARTIIFAALGLDSLLYVFSCKSLRKPIWKVKIWDNKYLIAAVFAGLGLQLVALYVPFFRTILKLDFVLLMDWAIIIPLAFIKIIGIETVKYIYIHKKVKSG